MKKIKKVIEQHSSSSDLLEYRRKIDKLDQQIIELLDQRASEVFKVGIWKQKNSKEIRDIQRENQILKKILSSQRSHLKNSEVQTLFVKLIEFFRTIEGARNLKYQVLESKTLPKKAKVGFLGFGLIGASVALGLFEMFPSWNFLVFDPKIDFNDFNNWNLETTNSHFEMVPFEKLVDLDFLFLAAPISANEANLNKLAKRNTFILNLGSYQSELKKVIGFHPLAGKETSGYQSAQADLFYDKTIVITHNELIRDETLSQAKALANLLGAEVTTCSVESHNKALAYSSHLVQLMALAFGLTLDKNHFATISSFIPKTAKDLLRLTGSNFFMWNPIMIRNKANILTAISDFERSFKSIRSIIENLKEPELKMADEEIDDLSIKASFRRMNSNFSTLRELFDYSNEIYSKIYLGKKAK